MSPAPAASATKLGQVKTLSPKDEWPEIIPLDRAARLPAFPLAALPTELAEWSEATAIAAQVPVDLPALLSLAVVSAVCAKRYEVQVRPGWVEPVNLYVAAAMDPGERKTSIFRSATRPVLEHERLVAGEMAPEIAKATTKHQIKERELKAAIEKAAKTGDGLDAHAASELGADLAAVRLPVVPRHFADDVTPERLAAMMAEQGGRIGLFSAEGGIFETLSGRYSDGVANLDLILKAHAGDHFRADRIKRAPVQIASPALTIALTVQPQVIAGLTERPELRGRGLLGRFLYSMPQSMVGRRDQSPPDVPRDVQAAYTALIQRLVAGTPKVDDSGEIVSETLAFAPETLAMFIEAGRALEPKLGPGGEYECIRDWATKHLGALARIAGLLHLAAGNSSIVSIPSLIGGKSLLLSPYLTEHALAAYQHMGADSNVGDAKKLLAWIHRTKATAFTKRDAFRDLQGSFKKSEHLDKPLSLLVEHGFIRELATPESHGPGRKPSPSFTVNPKGHKGHN